MMIISDIHDISSYRQSKIIVKDIEQIRTALKESYKTLTRYKKYVPVKPILNEILSAELVLKLALTKHKEIVKNKGKLNEEA